MNNSIYGTAMENVATNYMSHKIFDNNLIAIRKSKVELKLSKPGDIGMYISKLSKVLMYEFHYDYIKKKRQQKEKTTNQGYSQNTLKLKDTLKLKMSMNILRTIKKGLILVIIPLCQKNMMVQKVIGKMKDKTEGLAIEEFVGLKSKMYSLLVGNSEHKKE